MREELQLETVPGHSSADPYGREAVQVLGMQEGLQPEIDPYRSPAGPHRGETLQVP